MGVVKRKMRDGFSISESIKARAYPIGDERDFYTLIGRKVYVHHREIAVFKASDGKPFAIDNERLTPGGILLSEGIMSGHMIYDPSDDWKLYLETGAAERAGQIFARVPTYRIHIIKGKLHVLIF
ncbi:nitrite reductase (NAD(P)H) small subunit [Neobacillus mesonae]|nr:nitrite reductase (NAD(P)H) small subunit [Neobacillus mesonae]